MYESPAPELSSNLERLMGEIISDSEDFSSDDSIKDPTFKDTQNVTKKSCLLSFYENASNIILCSPTSSEDFGCDVTSTEIRNLPSNITITSSNSNTPTRKRKRQPNLWKSNIRKKQRQLGQEYINEKGILKSARKMKPSCKPECFYLCTQNFKENDRENIFKQFWNLSENEKNSFLCKYVKKEECKNRRRCNKENIYLKKKHSYIYFLNNNGRIIQTCKTFFLNTLSISERRVYYLFNNFDLSTNERPFKSRRSNCGRKSTSEDAINKVKQHINSFPTVDSHYCRQSTEKKFLEQNLNLTKMYNLYKEKEQNPVTISVYRNIFNYHFNLSFHIPRKDQCDKCCLYKINKSPTTEEKETYESHRQEHIYMKTERESDRKNIDVHKAIICYDLQNVFSLPRGNASNFYYKRKLCVFNLTATVIIPNKPKETYCAIWNEVMSGRSGNDIASALLKILNRVSRDHPEIKEIVLWSDSCVPQNRNQITSFALLKFLYHNENINIITQKFSEGGHSLIQEVDCVHSCIEKYLKGLEIASPLTLVKLLLQMNYQKVKLNIIQMNTGDFFLFSVQAATLNFQAIPFSKCKYLQYKKNDLFTVHYKSSAKLLNYTSVSMVKKHKGRFAKKITYDIYDKISKAKPKELSKEKQKDLRSMLKYIPEIDCEFYKALLHIE